MPAKRLPSVCCAARPSDDRGRRGGGHEVLVRQAGDAQRDEHRDDREEQADEEADGAGGARVHPAEQRGPRIRPMSRARPKPSSRSATAATSADRRVDAEQLLAEDEQRDRRRGEQREDDELDPRALDRARAELARQADLAPGVAVRVEHLAASWSLTGAISLTGACCATAPAPA